MKSLRELLRRKSPGFTIFEILVVLMIILVIGSIVLFSSVYNPAGYDLRTETEIIKTHLRYAQARAMNSNQVWGIEFFRDPSDNSYYHLFSYDELTATTTSMLLPGEESDPVALPTGMIISEVTVYFDDWGKPYAGVPSSTSSTTMTVTVDTEAVIITKNTGYIP